LRLEVDDKENRGQSLRNDEFFAESKGCAMAQVSYVNATCIYPNNPVPAVNELNLEIADGEFMVLVGPSGSGKSTALRMLAGLEPVSGGTVQIGGEDVSDKAPKDRDIAMVFQNYALYPHMSVAENMGFALKLRGVDKKERQAKVHEAAAMLDLEEYLGRRPGALSGGQRQRVAMGRAVVREPSVFLMDEPLSNLDAKLRVETRANIAALQARLGTTTIYVTHDQVEALTMGDRVAVLRDGLLQQVDTPRNLYNSPVNEFVAGFIGSPAMNLREARLVPGGALLGDVAIPLHQETLDAAHRAGLETVTLGLRPEGFTSSLDGPLRLQVTLVEELGADAYVYGYLPGDDPNSKPFVVRHSGGIPPAVGDVLGLDVAQGTELIFDPATGSRVT
jgi:multiple sugar transport system ATP-binding protein